MWQTLEKPKTVLASPGLLKEFMEMEPVPRERPLSERRISLYQRILDDGEFRTVIWASADCTENNTRYRINGQHTTVLLSRQPKLPEFMVTVERYVVATMTELVRLYNTFDSSLGSRNVADINLSFASSIPQLRELPPKIINLTVSAACDQAWPDHEQRIPPAERAEKLLDCVDFAVWLGKMLPGGGGGAYKSTTSRNASIAPLRRVAVVSAMLATFNKAPRVATEFWEKVREESAPDNKDATRTLARFLRSSVIAGGRGVLAPGTKSVSHREMLVKCLHAWNAWRKNETTNLNYYPTAPIPDVR